MGGGFHLPLHDGFAPGTQGSKSPKVTSSTPHLEHPGAAVMVVPPKHQGFLTCSKHPHCSAQCAKHYPLVWKRKISFFCINSWLCFHLNTSGGSCLSRGELSFQNLPPYYRPEKQYRSGNSGSMLFPFFFFFLKGNTNCIAKPQI